MIISKFSSVFLLAFLACLAIGCDPSGDSPKRPAPPSHQVEVARAAIMPVSHQQTVSGTLEAITSVRLYNEESGRITSLPFHEGDTINKGDVLVTLDNAILQAELDKAIAEKKQAIADLKRVEKLKVKNLASEEELHHANTLLNVAKAEEKLQRTRFMHTSIKAPFSGVITKRNNEPGDVVALHSHILSIIDPATMQVKLQVSERWIPVMQNGAEVEVLIDALGEKLHRGYISRIHPTIDPDTRKGTLEITLEPVPENARAGQLARVHITSQSTDRLVVPSRAVHHDMDGAYAYVVKNGKSGANTAVKHKLLKGSQYGNWIETISGIAAGDQVVVKGFLGLRNNKKVQVVTANNEQQPVNVNPVEQPPQTGLTQNTSNRLPESVDTSPQQISP